jgi:Ni/Co efflux regulator RcnB
MKKFVSFIAVVILSVSFSAPAFAQPRSSATSENRASQKINRKQQKAMKKYAKAQRKAERKMLKTERKNTRYPPQQF